MRKSQKQNPPCPFCEGNDSLVTRTHWSKKESATFRERKCVLCGQKFRTLERLCPWAKIPHVYGNTIEEVLTNLKEMSVVKSGRAVPQDAANAALRRGAAETPGPLCESSS